MSRPPDHAARMERTLVALDRLSTGDAFGERFFVHPDHAERLIEERALPAPPWTYTDDTVMALGIVEVLDGLGAIEQDTLARVFARRYGVEPHRSYGGAAHEILRNILTEIPWQFTAKAVFGGTGSMGNGGAMRVAPLGAYFADDLDEVVRQARASAEVTRIRTARRAPSRSRSQLPWRGVWAKEPSRDRARRCFGQRSATRRRARPGRAWPRRSRSRSTTIPDCGERAGLGLSRALVGHGPVRALVRREAPRRLRGGALDDRRRSRRS
jgi:hypothetical protein